MYLGHGVNKIFFFPPFKDTIQNFISTMKIKILAPVNLNYSALTGQNIYMAYNQYRKQ